MASVSSVIIHFIDGMDVVIKNGIDHPYRVELYQGPILHGVREGTLYHCRTYIRETTGLSISISTFNPIKGDKS